MAALIPVATALAGLAATLTITGGWTLRNIEFFVAGSGSAISLCAVIGVGLAGHNWLNGPPRGAGDLLTKTVTGWAGWPAAGQYHVLAHGRVFEITKGTFPSTALLVGGGFVLPAILVGALVFLTRAWPRFVITRLLLAGSGRLPWRVSSFLADARNRNLLRHVSGWVLVSLYGQARAGRRIGEPR